MDFRFTTSISNSISFSLEDLELKSEDKLVEKHLKLTETLPSTATNFISFVNISYMFLL
jgi:hypothetical protein